MSKTIQEKQSQLKNLFESLTAAQRYEKIIEMGRTLPSFPDLLRTDAHLVKGCQSLMYLSCAFSQGKLLFNACSDALISKGLAALLLSIYNDESPKAILTTPLTLIKDLNLPSLISPGRSNGLASLYTRIQQHALKEIQGLDSDHK